VAPKVTYLQCGHERIDISRGQPYLVFETIQSTPPDSRRSDTDCSMNGVIA
jgi:hypothetical protein